MMPQKGEKIGAYVLERPLGRGGFGEVWLGSREGAVDTTQVAIKLPRDDKELLVSIQDEARIWVQAGGHPNILPIIEADIYEGQIAVVSEYVAEGSLEDWLSRRGGGPIPIEDAVDIGLGILVGLEHLHARQILHRDLKPANVLMQQGIPRLTDFGLARVVSDLAHSGSASGTPAYMAPEAFSGERSVPTDLWSVGVLLYQLLAGRLPFPQRDLVSLMRAVTDSQPVDVPTSYPPLLRDVLSHALEKNPALRFQTAAQMRASLRESLRETAAVTETIQVSPGDFAPRYLTVAVTGTMATDPERTKRRLRSLLRPYHSPYSTWYVGTLGVVDEETVRQLGNSHQHVLLVGYGPDDISPAMEALVQQYELPIVDPQNEWIPNLPGAPSARDIYFITKADLVILVWDGKSLGTAELVEWLRQERKDHLVAFV